jgi:hypothetical protein
MQEASYNNYQSSYEEQKRKEDDFLLQQTKQQEIQAFSRNTYFDQPLRTSQNPLEELRELVYSQVGTNSNPQV